MASEPKTRPTDASVDAFIAGVDEKRQADCATIRGWMADATGEPAVMWGPSIIGFGTYLYTYASRPPTEWPLIGFSPRKNDLTLYLAPSAPGYDALLANLGKHKSSKACLYIKRLSDVDTDVLQEMIDLSVRHSRAQQ